MTLYSSGTDASIHAKNFYIDTAGDLTAQNVNVTGVVNATTGTFTTIGVDGTITIGSGGSITDGSTYTFDNSGGTLAGWTITAAQLQKLVAGASGYDVTLKSDTNPSIYVGKNIDASYRIYNMSGQMYWNAS